MQSTAAPPSSGSLETPDAAVYFDYDSYEPPPHPGADWTRFVCISDTHGHVFPVPDGDVLLHTGDMTGKGQLSHFQKTVDWLCELPHPTKILIAGNHDLPLHTGWYDERYEDFSYRNSKEDVNAILAVLKGAKARAANLVYLQDEAHRFKAKEGGKEWTVFGSPWQPWFFDWAFNYQPGEEAEALISAIPPVDILLTHGPPHGILDLTVRNVQVGCPTLLAHLPRIHPRLHVFGHIHESHGAEVYTLPRNSGGVNEKDERVVMVNASNYPTGRKAIGANGVHAAVGGPGFQPVIVDLLDVSS